MLYATTIKREWTSKQTVKDTGRRGRRTGRIVPESVLGNVLDIDNLENRLHGSVSVHALKNSAFREVVRHGATIVYAVVCG